MHAKSHTSDQERKAALLIQRIMSAADELSSLTERLEIACEQLAPCTESAHQHPDVAEAAKHLVHALDRQTLPLDDDVRVALRDYHFHIDRVELLKMQGEIA